MRKNYAGPVGQVATVFSFMAHLEREDLLVVRYLRKLPRVRSVILLTGKQLGTIRESCEIARL